MGRGVALLLVVVAGCLEAPPGGAGGGDPDAGRTGADAGTGRADRMVSGTFRHFCAVADGGAWCWGNNGQGQLGDGSQTHRSTAVQVMTAQDVPLTGVLQIAPGERHSCALLADATVVCWGSNAAGQLGGGVDDDLDHAYAETAVMDLVDAVEISAGGDHTCARRSDASVVCWGRGVSGELGDGTNTDRATVDLPVEEQGRPIESSRVSAGRYHSCLVDAAGRVACTGENEDGQSGQRDGEPPDAICGYSTADQVSREDGSPLGLASDVSAGARHTCAIVDDNVFCFGHARCGELGNGDPESCSATPADNDTCLETVLRLYPVEVTLPADCVPVELALGGSHTCTRCADQTVECWGSGARGRLGQGDVTQHDTPVAVKMIDSAIAIAAGAESSCATLADRSIVCWGSSEFGQIGDGTPPMEGDVTIFQTLPTPVLGLPAP